MIIFTADGMTIRNRPGEHMQAQPFTPSEMAALIPVLDVPEWLSHVSEPLLDGPLTPLSRRAACSTESARRMRRLVVSGSLLAPRTVEGVREADVLKVLTWVRALALYHGVSQETKAVIGGMLLETFAQPEVEDAAR